MRRAVSIVCLSPVTRQAGAVHHQTQFLGQRARVVRARFLGKLASLTSSMACLLRDAARCAGSCGSGNSRATLTKMQPWKSSVSMTYSTTSSNAVNWPIPVGPPCWSYKPLPFRAPLFYKRVRYPLCLGWAIAFWATPSMSWGHLLFAGVLTGYMALAARFEERDLLAHFGYRYAQYRGRVPMFVPRFSSAATAAHDRRQPEQDSPSAEREALHV